MARACAKCGQPATAGFRDGPGGAGDRCLRCVAITEVLIEGTEECRMAAPEQLLRGPAANLVTGPEGEDVLWRHQALALTMLAEGKNVVVATSTASGKSKIFQAWTINEVMSDPKATAMVFYPTKALANDQEDRWRRICVECGLMPDTVGQINGDIKPMSKREKIIRESRIVIMTPDVCHAWLTRQTGVASIKTFISRLRCMILDEAHTYEDVFGSNCAYLFRRLLAASANAGNERQPRLIATTATILEPGEHMRKLTGLPFEVVGEEQNGTKRYPRTLLHVGSGQKGKSLEENAAQVIVDVIDNDPEARMIVFHDSRQGVERICQVVGRPEEVVPYRSGYLAEDRRRTEQSLHRGRIRAVIATSALELGIDVPDLSYGMNLDLTQSRKQIRQRIGRVGRSGPGTFVILAPSTRFAEYGETMKEYFENSVEPSQLYLENEHIEFQHALCLKSELKDVRLDTKALPESVDWPTGFARALKNAHGMPPPHLREISGRGESSPHRSHSVRSIGEENLDIIMNWEPRTSKGIGNINVSAAFREAYPGAIYRHLGKSYVVEGWARRPEDRSCFIRVTPMSNTKSRTWPLLQRAVSVSLDDDSAVGGRISPRDHGLVAQVKLRVSESVEGYRDQDQQSWSYRELQKSDPRKTRKQREFPTTGVYIEIDEEWFTGDSGEGWQARSGIALVLRRHLAYRKSIALPNLRAQVENVFLAAHGGHWLSDQGIVIYDNLPGGLGLTEDLYFNLDQYAERILHGVTHSLQGTAGDRLPVRPQDAARFREWAAKKARPPGQPAPAPDPGKWWRVVRLGSEVRIYSPKSREMVNGVVRQLLWKDQALHLVQTQEGEEMEVTEGELDQAAPKPEWQIWRPETGIRQELIHPEE